MFEKQEIITFHCREKPIPAGNFPKDSFVGLFPGADWKYCVWGSRKAGWNSEGEQQEFHENTSEKQNNFNTRKHKAKIKAQNP